MGTASATAGAPAAAKSRHATAGHHKGKPHKALKVDAAIAYGSRDDALLFATEAASRHGLPAEVWRDALAAARFVPSVARLIMPPAIGVAKNWTAYRDRFVEPVRLRTGLAFWQTHQHWLEKAEERYGVPPAIVIGILGVESIYGQQMGSFRVIDALATLSFDFPSGRKDRSAFFRNELEQYLLMTWRQGLDPLALRGSYAGAMGMPQFMPSSVNRLAVDFDGDGHIDLATNAADVIGSVAHYLAEFGWKRGMPTYFNVAPPTDAANRAVLLSPDIVPSFSAREMTEQGATLDAQGARFDGPLALIELENGGVVAPSYKAGTANFYALTRYNWSSYYAMAVIELGEAIERQRLAP